MPELIDKIDDEDLKAAFKKAVARIWQNFINQSGLFPDYYVIRTRKK